MIVQVILNVNPYFVIVSLKILIYQDKPFFWVNLHLIAKK